MKRYAFALVVGGLALVSVVPARAQTTSACTYSACTYATIDSVAVTDRVLFVRGIPQGEAAAVEQTFSFSTTSTSTAVGAALETCARMALLAMERPGEYLFGFQVVSSGYPKCKLSRVNL